MKKVFILTLLLLVSPLSVLADDVTPEIATSTVTITIRSGSTTAFTGVIEIAASTTPPVDIAPTNSSSTVSVPADSLLATLVALDATTTDFDITDLAYFSSFNSFLINCISVPLTSSTDCYNWTYAVNGSFPQVGVDDQILHDGDVVYLFFGPPQQTVLSTSTAIVGEQFTATAQSYDLASGTYVGTPGLTLGVGIPNPDFSFTEFATSTSDTNGQAIFTMNATGTFAVGIQEDFYFPSASITIVDAPATTTPETPAPTPSSGGGGGISHILLNTPSALAYLASKQKPDGSFDSLFLTDWAALAFAASDPGTPKTLLRDYLLAASPSLSSVTDYERHAMALMALGINPYSGTQTNYIAPIIAAFDGTQIGSIDFENDDIFALFPLLHAGYGANDDIIQKTVAFIISRQLSNGSWIGGVDMTAAAIQALTLVPSLSNVSTALTKAENYLRSQQQSNGGWGNSFSTSWALQAIAALGQSPSNWAPNGLNPVDYLANLQQPDGGLEPTTSDMQTRIWATEYAIPASLGRTWTSLLQSFPKPVNTTNSGGAILGVSTSTATTTPTAATSTPITATSTPLVATSTSETVVASTTVAQEIKPTPKPVAKKAPALVAKKVPEVTPPIPAASTSTPSQTASASVPSESFLGKIWHAVTSFFTSLF